MTYSFSVNGKAISLIICTRDREASLRRALESIDPTDLVSNNAEVIIVDNGSTDGTPALLGSIASAASYDLLTLTEAARGKCRALNAGLAASQGSIIVFTDDDCLLPEDFFSTVARVFSENAFEYCGGRLIEEGDSVGQNHDKPSLLPPGSFLTPGQLAGACMAFRSEVFEAVGPFDPELGPGTPWRGDDIDILQRASFGGFTGAYVPQLYVTHAHGRDGSALRSLATANARARGAYYAKFAFRSYRHAWVLFRNLDPRRITKRGSVSEIVGALHYWSTRISRLWQRMLGS